MFMKVVSFHLFNDYSGSPKVLKMVLEGLANMGYDIDLVTSRGGVLDELVSDQIHHYGYSYKFSMNPLVTMIRYTYAQIFTFFFAFRYLLKKDVCFYINTILPVGPALAGRLMGKRVVYHYHENSFAKSGFYRFLAFLMQRFASEIICVSVFQKSNLKRSHHVHVVPNALPVSFTQQMSCDPGKSFDNQNVLMVTSLKKYKGILQFFDLADRLPQYQFNVVVNDELSTIHDFVKSENLHVPNNLHVHPRQEDVAPYYQKASLVLNLSDTTQVLETFGLTALEAMSAALPVIVPTQGGVAELVEDGINGYKIDVCHLEKIEEKIVEILSDEHLYARLSKSAYEKAQSFSADKIMEMISAIIKDNSL